MKTFRIITIIASIPLSFIFVGYLVFNEGKPAHFFAVPLVSGLFLIFFVLPKLRSGSHGDSNGGSDSGSDIGGGGGGEG